MPIPNLHFEEVIPAHIKDKVHFFATKEDVTDFKAEVANFRSKMKGAMANIKADLTKYSIS